MGAKSQDGCPRGTRVVDRDGDVWRKGTAWWLWTGRHPGSGPGKLLWSQLVERYGPIEPTSTTSPKAALWIQEAQKREGKP